MRLWLCLPAVFEDKQVESRTLAPGAVIQLRSAQILICADILSFLHSHCDLYLTSVMPLPSYLIDSAAVLNHMLKTTTNPYVLGIGGVISILVEVFHHT